MSNNKNLSPKELAKRVSEPREEFERQTEELNKRPMSEEERRGWLEYLEAVNGPESKY